MLKRPAEEAKKATMTIEPLDMQTALGIDPDMACSAPRPISIILYTISHVLPIIKNIQHPLPSLLQL